MWLPIYILPNIKVRDPIETDNAILIARNDPRCQSLEETYPNFRKFMNFTDNFGRCIEPSLFMLSSEGPNKQFPSTWGASFRDIISISMVSYSYSLAARFPGSQRKIWSDYLEIYPWMIDKNFENVIGQTHAFLGLDEVDDFKGVSSPFTFQSELTVNDYDTALAGVLFRKWKQHFIEDDNNWELTSLFRSLNMAFHASKLPGGREVNIFDIGRTLSLWISAFEILAHPGRDGKVGKKEVFTMLEKASWLQAENTVAHFNITDGGKPLNVIGPCWLYNEILKARNNFLHGNPVTRDSLKVGDNFLPTLAAPLFRMALTSSLNISFEEPAPHEGELEKLVEHRCRMNSFLAPQNYAESAIKKSFPRI